MLNEAFIVNTRSLSRIGIFLSYNSESLIQILSVIIGTQMILVILPWGAALWEIIIVINDLIMSHIFCLLIFDFLDLIIYALFSRQGYLSSID